MNLLSDKTNFLMLINNAARSLNIAVNYIEKDYYALSVLKELIKRNDKFVFKGGTSLSVCQHVINRFSEDVDISYEDEIITVGTRRKIKTAFFESIEAAGLTVGNAENIRSRRIFNRYLCPYKSEFADNDDKVIVEWATQTPAFPIEIKQAQTIIGKYLTDIGRLDLVQKYELEPFDVKTITKERTFVDKIFAICDYHISKKLDRQSRHIYDLNQLLNYINLDQNVIDLIDKVKQYRLSLDTCYSVKQEKPHSALIEEIIKEKTYFEDYQTKTFPLLYDHVPYDKCIESLKKIAAFLKANNL